MGCKSRGKREGKQERPWKKVTVKEGGGGGGERKPACCYQKGREGPRRTRAGDAAIITAPSL